MDRDNSPSPSPRGLSALGDTSFTSPPFMSTLPLPITNTRRTSDSELHTRNMPGKARRSDRHSHGQHLRTRSATASISSRASSLSRPPSPAEEIGDGRLDLGNYTIDLANLGQSSAGGRDLFAAMGGSEIEVPVRERGTVASEDDGPEDFTINLGKWMRGNGEWKNEINDGERDKEENGSWRPVDIMDGTRRKGMQPSSEDLSEEENVEESVVVTTAPNVSEEEVTKPQEPSKSLPTTPLNHRNHHDQALHISPPNSSALEVELENLRLQAESYRREIESLDQERVQLDGENEDMAKELHAAKLSLEQSERAKADYRQRWIDTSKEQEASASNLTSLQTKFQLLSQELEGTRTHAETIRMASAEEMAISKEDLQTAQAQLVDLPELKDHALADSAELSSLRAELARCKQDLLNEQGESKRREEALMSQVEDFRARAMAAEKKASEVAFLNQELLLTQAQLTETRRLLETVEDENDGFTQRNERQAEEFKELQTEVGDFKRSMQSLQEDIKERDVRIERLDGEVKQLQLELGDPKTQQDQHELFDSTVRSSEKIDATEADMRLADQLDTLSTHYEEELSSLKRVHEAEIKKLKGTLLRAADGMQKREARITKAHAAEVKMLRENMARLERENAGEAKRFSVDASKPRKESETRPSKDRDDIEELRSAIRVLSSKLKTACEELRKAREAVHELETQADEREREQEEREEDQDAVNRALEERLAGVFQKREKEWRRRIGLVLRDRDMMGKALMWSWGKDEVGEREREVKANGERAVQRGMGYRYQLAKH